MLWNVKLKIKKEQNTKYRLQYTKYNMIIYKECTITINGQDFYHDTDWKKVNITVCFLKSKWPDWGDFLYKNEKFVMI